MVTYQLRNTARNKLLIYKETVNFFFMDKEVVFSLNTGTCECEYCQFCDHYQNHKRTNEQVLQLQGAAYFQFLIKYLIILFRQSTITFKIYQKRLNFQWNDLQN